MGAPTHGDRAAPAPRRPAEASAEQALGDAGLPGLSRRDYQRLSAFIERQYGIRLPEAKRTLLEARLGKRVRELGLGGFGAYCDLVLSGTADGELVHMMDRVTTNKTDFFREPAHFEVLVRDALPALAALAAAASGPRRPLHVWSAACSTGEEPYTLAMVLAEVAQGDPAFRFDILATDLSTRVLETARRAVYADGHVEPIPLALRRKYLLRAQDDPSRILVRRALRERVTFRRLNFLDRNWDLPARMDVIFCRNVLIYFDRALQIQILRRLAGALVPGGFLFIGHSETIHGADLPFQLVSPTVYRFPGDASEGRSG